MEREPGSFLRIYHAGTAGSPARLLGPASPGPGPNEDPIAIPNSFKMYYRAFYRRPRAYLAQHKLQPLFALTYSRRELTLHRGIESTSPEVATYFNHGNCHHAQSSDSAHVRLQDLTSGAGAQP